MMRLAESYINGIRREIFTDRDKYLPDVIRNDVGLTGTERGCEFVGRQHVVPLTC
jgi:aerobic-type carbon monoxide dehydrogenase small subunit (CoxS/CutS family)